MSKAGKSLLAEAGLSKGDMSEAADKEHDKEKDEPHPGKEAAMSAFTAASKGGDHVGMSQALSDFIDIHTKE
jgi:hypothetical protein